MKSKEYTIALRFADTFAPLEGTIQAHKKLINEKGFVWYGKLGPAVSNKVANIILSSPSPRILLIHSGKTERYWAYITDIRHDVPPKQDIPTYYRDNTDSFKTWFKIYKIIDAPKRVLNLCTVVSSNRPLSDVSKSSINPYFIINVEEE